MKADQMWKESKPAVGGQAPKDDNKQWDKKEDWKKEESWKPEKKEEAWNKDNTQWGKSDWDQSSGSSSKWQKDEEKRIHPSDKSKTPYSFEQYLEETKGDKRKAEQMWNESKLAEGE